MSTSGCQKSGLIISSSSGKADEVVTLDFEEGDGEDEVVGDTVTSITTCWLGVYNLQKYEYCMLW